uniref:Mitochondrial carnitine/acylcarnitine carrier protein n=1 Tax=Cacopsylla melanoneura TaxID=428564 RepID=A0A8D8T8B1_9HEMI
MAEDKVSPFQYFIAGGIGGVVMVSVGHPFDTCKVRMQATTSHAPEYTSTIDCFKKILKNETVTGLFKGMGAPITAVAPMNALNYFGYGTGVKFFSNDENNGRLASWEYYVSGSVSGIATAVLVTPGWYYTILCVGEYEWYCYSSVGDTRLVLYNIMCRGV